MIRPLTAIGEVHCRTPPQLSALVKTAAPVSPSTAFSLPPATNQTSGSDLPSVVVEIGDAEPAAAHQTICGFTGAPAPISTPITACAPTDGWHIGFAPIASAT